MKTTKSRAVFSATVVILLRAHNGEKQRKYDLKNLLNETTKIDLEVPRRKLVGAKSGAT